MSGLLWFPRVSQGSARPPWCMARTLFASVQQCRPACCARPRGRARAGWSGGRLSSPTAVFDRSAGRRVTPPDRCHLHPNRYNAYRTAMLAELLPERRHVARGLFGPLRSKFD
jgi:hypothetical protein